MPDQRVVLEVVIRPSDLSAEPRETRATCWLFPGKAAVIGRSPRDADLPVTEDPSLSKQHFSVAYDGQRCRLVDLASKNGTLVNGSRVEAVDLRHGDVVCAGQTVFRVSVVDAQPMSDESSSGELTVVTDPSDSAEAAPGLPPEDCGEPDGEEPSQDGLFLTLTVVATPSVSSDDLKVSRMMAWIRAGQTILVGRSGWNSDWTFRGDERMSANHFSVTCDGRKCSLHDQGSANGTYVNQRRVTHAELHDADRIRAGQTEFAIQIMGRG